LVEEARNLLKLVQIKQANEKVALERKRKDLEKEAKEKAEGTYKPPVGI